MVSCSEKYSMSNEQAVATAEHFSTFDAVRVTGVLDRTYRVRSRVSIRLLYQRPRRRFVIRSGAGPYRSRVVLCRAATVRLALACGDGTTIEGIYRKLHGTGEELSIWRLKRILRALGTLEDKEVVECTSVGGMIASNVD